MYRASELQKGKAIVGAIFAGVMGLPALWCIWRGQFPLAEVVGYVFAAFAAALLMMSGILALDARQQRQREDAWDARTAAGRTRPQSRTESETI